MTVLLSIVIALALVVFQTTVMADLPVLEGFYDLLVPFVVYLGLFRPAKEGIPIVVCTAFVMDGLSAAPFGLYLTGYLWIFAGIRWIIRYLQVRTSALVLFVVPVAVAVETLFSLTTLGMQLQAGIGFHAVTEKVGMHLLWALFTGPFFLLFYDAVHDRLEKWAVDRKAERNGF